VETGDDAKNKKRAGRRDTITVHRILLASERQGF
jgi:hypothetical protein